MKQIITFFIVTLLSSCNFQKQNKHSENEESKTQSNQLAIPIILASSLENRRPEFQDYVNSARRNIMKFAKMNGWEDLAEEEFMDSVIIFDDKSIFNVTLLKLAGEDTTMKLPDTYCAALEKGNLISMSPEFYSSIYPEGIEEGSYEKLLTHEIAHRLHVRILKGHEDDMGPIWFYEGFAMYVANQFAKSDIVLSKTEMITILNEPDRGSYMKYNYIFRYFANKIPLNEFILKAKNEEFNEELILMLE